MYITITNRINILVITSQTCTLLLKVEKKKIVIITKPQNGYAESNFEIKIMHFVGESLKISFILLTDDPIQDLSLSRSTYLLIALNSVQLTSFVCY